MSHSLGGTLRVALLALACTMSLCGCPMYTGVNGQVAAYDHNRFWQPTWTEGVSHTDGGINHADSSLSHVDSGHVDSGHAHSSLGHHISSSLVHSSISHHVSMSHFHSTFSHVSMSHRCHHH